MASIIAPSRPNISQPTTNATTAPIPSAPQFMFIAISYHMFIIAAADLLYYRHMIRFLIIRNHLVGWDEVVVQAM
jgi:hypothetical protein